jgi:hypothetical protein
MQMLEERQCATMEQQKKFFQKLLQQNRVERPENQGVTLLDFQIPSQYPSPMPQSQWTLKIG